MTEKDARALEARQLTITDTRLNSSGQLVDVVQSPSINQAMLRSQTLDLEWGRMTAAAIAEKNRVDGTALIYRRAID